MKPQPHAKPVILTNLALALALAMVIWSPTQAQTAEHATGNRMMDSKRMECCQKIQTQKQNMMTEMKAQDAALTELVAKMNGAPADKKTDLMADILTQMVEQRVAMHANMEEMQAGMMQHMKQCPMMKNMDEKPTDDHKSH